MLREAIKDRYPGRLVPYHALHGLAKEFGVTRARVDAASRAILQDEVDRQQARDALVHLAILTHHHPPSSTFGLGAACHMPRAALFTMDPLRTTCGHCIAEYEKES